MTEWILIIWVTVGGMMGSHVSDPEKVGTYRMQADCLEAAEQVVVSRLGDKRGGVTAVCVERDKQ